jgi:hypothetical protein
MTVHDNTAERPKTIRSHIAWKYRSEEEKARRFEEMHVQFAMPPERSNSGHFMACQMDDQVRAYNAAPVVALLQEGFRGDALIAALREQATPRYCVGFEGKIPIASPTFQVETVHPLTSTSTQTSFGYSDDSIQSIEMDCDQGEHYIQCSLRLVPRVEFQDRPIRPKDSGVLDTATPVDVTPDWDELLELRRTRRYWKNKNALISRYLHSSYPMDRDDLDSELDIAVALAIPRFKGRKQWNPATHEFEEPELHTFLWPVMENRLRNLVRSADAPGQSVPLVPNNDPDAASNEPIVEPDYVAAIHLHDALRTVPDANLILLQQAGYTDSEIADTNIRMRRSRVRGRLVAFLDAA